MILLALLLAAAVPAMTAHPEASVYSTASDATNDVTRALDAAAIDGRKVIIIMGANWCHDSRALAGWFATPRFAAMLGGRYEVVYVDVGTPQTGKGRNLDVARRFGIKKVKNTPLVMVVSASGKLLNSRKNAVSWRNAASRSEDDIYSYFSAFTEG